MKTTTSARRPQPTTAPHPPFGHPLPIRWGEGPANASIWLVALGFLLGLTAVQADDVTVHSYQAFQTALTVAAENNQSDVIYLAKGYYGATFNYNSSQSDTLMIKALPGLAPDDVVLDGNGGTALSLNCSVGANFVVQGITFMRNGNGLAIATQGDVEVSGAQFLGRSNWSGGGIRITAARKVTVANNTVKCIESASGQGVYVFSAGEILVQGNIIAGNRSDYGSGLSLSNSTGMVTITNNSITGNSGPTMGHSSGGGVYLRGAPSGVMFAQNTLSANSAPSWHLSGSSYFQSGRCGGADIYISRSGSAVSFIGNTVTDNNASSDYGGACLEAPGGILVSNCVFRGNSSGGSGGAIMANNCSLVIQDSQFRGNGAVWGGAFCSSRGSVLVERCQFVGNSASTSGGAGYLATIGSYLTARDSAFQQNSAPSGGALNAPSGATLDHNVFEQNTATSSGAAIVVNGGANVTRNRFARNVVSNGNGGAGVISASPIAFHNNLAFANTASLGEGGAFWLQSGSTLDMLNNTITENKSAKGGGVRIYVAGTTEVLRVHNNIIWGNSATGDGDDVFLNGTGQRKTFSFNNAHDMVGAWDVALNNIDRALLFYDPPTGLYQLRLGSPCINTGTNAIGLLPATDLDGQPRIAGATVDLGCYEFSNTAFHPADVNGDWIITDAEYTAYAAAWKNDQSWPTSPSPIPADFATRAGFLKVQNGGTYHNDGGAQPICWKPGL